MRPPLDVQALIACIARDEPLVATQAQFPDATVAQIRLALRRLAAALPGPAQQAQAPAQPAPAPPLESPARLPPSPPRTRAVASTLVVYSDGASRGNPGPAAAGWVICEKTGRQIAKGGLFLGKRTNNEAEYAAAIMGLKAASELGATDVTLRADSELLVRQLQGRYQVKNARLLPLFKELKNLSQTFGKFAAQHVPREQNTAADEQANLALDKR